MTYNKKKLKIAFLGGSVKSAVGRAHFSSINLDNRYQLISGCFSRNKELNLKTAREYGLESKHVYNDINELIKTEKDSIDAIILLTPTNQHAKQILTCLNEGLPVISEKAVATTTKEANKIRNVLNQHSGFLAVIYNYLGYPMLRELKYLIEEDELGKIYRVQIEMPQESFKRVNAEGKPIVAQQWRLYDGIIPTISLDLGVHLHSIIKYLTGESPVRVVSSSNSFGNFPGIVDDVSCIIEYTNNMICDMWYSKVAIGERNGLKIRVFGENKSVEWIQENPEYLKLADKRGRRWTMDRGDSEVKIANQARYTRFKAGHPSGFIEAFANYYYDVADALEFYLKDKKISNVNYFGINEAIEGLELFESISKSSFNKKWEKI